MTRTKLVVTAVLFSCCVAMPDAQRLDSVRKVIDSYRVAIQLAQKDPSRGRLEAAFDAIGPLRDALVLSREGGVSTLELLSEREFTTLGRELVGLLVNREEVVFVKPDVVFFRSLAARGDPADRAFFAALSSTYPESVWPIYIQSQTDFSGCTRFGSGTLVSTYLTWVAVKRQYPKRYEEASSDHLKDIISALTESTCACGDRASVEQELSEFVQRAEASDVRTQVEARLVAVRSDRAKIRFTCVPG
jgi:hypothetical protein